MNIEIMCRTRGNHGRTDDPSPVRIVARVHTQAIAGLEEVCEANSR